MADPILQKIINARKILILDYPFWGSLALRLGLQESNFPFTGWTDGKVVGYNPERVEPLTLLETVGWFAHEVAHCVFQHPFRRNGRNRKLFNIAGDYVINGILLKEKFILPGNPRVNSFFDGMNVDEVYAILEKNAALQEMARQQKLEKHKKGNSGKGGKNEDENKSQKEKDDSDESDPDNNSSDLSDKSMDDEQDSDETGMDGNSSADDYGDEEDFDNDSDDLDNDDDSNKDDNNEDQWDSKEDGWSDEEDWNNEEDMDPNGNGAVMDYPSKDSLDNEDPFPASSSEMKEQEQDWKIAAVQAKINSKRYGNLAGATACAVQELVEPKVDPKEILQKFIAMTAKNDFMWAPPNKKYIQQNIYLPSLRSEELGTVIITIDTSISIRQSDLDQFAAITSAILEAYQKIEVIVLYCDTHVYEPQYFSHEDLPIKLELKGRGGTDFRPPFAWIKENNIEPLCFLYFTDLECDLFPKPDPYYPVMWVCTNSKESGWWTKPPFGEILFIEFD